MAAPTVEQLRQRQEEGFALTREAQQRVREHEAAELEAAREQARAKRITENLDLEPRLRSAAEEAQADLKSLVTQIVSAITKARDTQAAHEAVARALRHDGERCPQIPSVKISSISDRTLARDLEALRFAVQSDW